MDKGISVWIFSKLVMFTFLLLTFAAVAGFLSILSERSYADSAEVMAVRIKDSFVGVASTGSLEARRIIPIPKRLPEDVRNVAPRTYFIKIWEDAGANSVSIAIGWGNDPDSKAYVAASQLYISSKTTIVSDSPDNSLELVTDKNCKFLIITKKYVAGNPQIKMEKCADITVDGDCLHVGTC